VQELDNDREAAAQRVSPETDWVARAVADPFLNALHVALEQRHETDFLRELSDEESLDLKKLLEEGPAALDQKSLHRILMSPRALDTSYRRLWTQAPENLAPTWHDVLNEYRP
jgi:hypothetical protein